MTTQEMRLLKCGDVLRHRGNGRRYIVVGNSGGRATAIDAADITNPNEWDIVVKSNPKRVEKPEKDHLPEVLSVGEWYNIRGKMFRVISVHALIPDAVNVEDENQEEWILQFRRKEA